jgi:hypothetical protein
MNVLVYSDPTLATPYLRVVSAGLDTLQEFAFKFLDPYGITYAEVDESLIPPSPYIGPAQTVDTSVTPPTFDWVLDEAQRLATSYNSEYWQNQYNQGLFGLSITNDYQLQLAIATPEAERTADQVAAVEFLSGINGLQQDVQDQIDAATSGTELISILSQLG